MATQYKDAINPGVIASNPFLGPQGIGAFVGGTGLFNAGGAFGGSKSLSGGERNQNELNDIRRQLLDSGRLTEDERYLLTTPQTNATTEELLKRYQTISGSNNDVFKYWMNRASSGGGPDLTNKYAYDTFKSTFGRDPSTSEYAQLLPVFGGAEGRQRGAAYVAQLYDQYKQSPEYLKTQAGQYSDELAPLYQELLGRGARTDEQDYYGQLLAAGVPEYEIRQRLQATPEYQTNQDTKFRSGLASELEGYDTSFFDKAKENVLSRFARQGGGVGQSSALDFALTDLMGKIAEKRGSYLSGLSASQYGGNKEAAREDYRTGMGRYFDEQDYNRRQQDSERDYYRSRADQERDYERQASDYQNYLNSQKQRRSPWGQLVGGAIGAGLGGFLSRSPQGVSAGYNVGSGLGGGYDYLNY